MYSDIVFETDRRYQLMLPLMWLIATWVCFKKRIARMFASGEVLKTNFLLFDGVGPLCHEIRLGAKSWKALHILYNFHPKKVERFGDILDNLWLKSPNAQAVRNRHKIACAEVLAAATEMSKVLGTREIRILSLAAGSAEGVIEAIGKLRDMDITVHSLLVDMSQEALDFAKNYAAERGLQEQISVKRTFIHSRIVRRVAADFKPDLVEMMGLLDYFQEDDALTLINAIYEVLPVGGKFFTCNIIPNLESAFLREVIDWDMVYRRPEQLQRVCSNAGFGSGVRLVSEPFGIHAVAICEKSLNPQPVTANVA